MAKFSKNYPPPSPLSTPATLHQKSTCSIRFASSNPFQNVMTQPSSIKNCKVITFQAKNHGAGQGLPRRHWARVLPTQKLLGTNQANPESFIPIDPTIEKLISNLIITLTTGPPGRSNQKSNMHLLKFNFRRGLF